jgi:hypothetical protein
MDTYSAAGHSTTDTCPRCGAALTGGVRWSLAESLLRVRTSGAQPPEPDAEPDAPPATAAP